MTHRKDDGGKRSLRFGAVGGADRRKPVILDISTVFDRMRVRLPPLARIFNNKSDEKCIDKLAVLCFDRLVCGGVLGNRAAVW